MDYVRVKSYAKINLSLDITGVSGGYHMLDSVVTTIDVFDLITLKKRKKDRLVSVNMHGMGSEGIPHGDNNAAKAAEAFVKEFNTCGVDVDIYKNIPMGAGLGGSSADVAGVLNGLKRLYAINDNCRVKAIADGIGSDCGYMLTGGYARLSGRGERVTDLDCDLKLNLLLLIPKEPVSTPACYKAYDSINCTRPPASEDVCTALRVGDKAALGRALNNALIPAALTLNSEVGEAVAQLQEFSPLGVSMTGSGSCVYALFENDQFCSYAFNRYRGDFRAIVTKTHLPKRED